MFHPALIFLLPAIALGALAEHEFFNARRFYSNANSNTNINTNQNIRARRFNSNSNTNSNINQISGARRRNSNSNSNTNQNYGGRGFPTKYSAMQDEKTRRYIKISPSYVYENDGSPITVIEDRPDTEEVIYEIVDWRSLPDDQEGSRRQSKNAAGHLRRNDVYGPMDTNDLDVVTAGKMRWDDVDPDDISPGVMERELRFAPHKLRHKQYSSYPYRNRVPIYSAAHRPYPSRPRWEAEDQEKIPPTQQEYDVSYPRKPQWETEDQERTPSSPQGYNMGSNVNTNTNYNFLSRRRSNVNSNANSNSNQILGGRPQNPVRVQAYPRPARPKFDDDDGDDDDDDDDIDASGNTNINRNSNVNIVSRRNRPRRRRSVDESPKKSDGKKLTVKTSDLKPTTVRSPVTRKRESPVITKRGM